MNYKLSLEDQISWNLQDMYDEPSVYPTYEMINSNPLCPSKPYDFLLKFLLVGDSDVGKEEIINSLEQDEFYYNSPGDMSGLRWTYKPVDILLDGKRIRLHLWDTSGQGRFSTIIRSYSRGAQGILLVYDITNKWSFTGLNRWLKEIEEHAPGIPKILLGNRLHLAFRRQVNEETAEAYANKHNMSFFEISTLCNYNVKESLVELSRMALRRIKMENWRKDNIVLSLQELCCRAIVARTSVYAIEQLPLPVSLKSCLKSYSSLSNNYGLYFRSLRQIKASKNKKSLTKRAKALISCDNFSKALSFHNTSTNTSHNSQNNESHFKNTFCCIS